MDLPRGLLHVHDAWDPRERALVGTKSPAGVRTVKVFPLLGRTLAEYALAAGRPAPRRWC